MQLLLSHMFLLFMVRTSPLSFDMARYSLQVQCACTIARLSPCTLWPFSFSLKSRDAKMAGQQHLGLFLFLSGPFGA